MNWFGYEPLPPILVLTEEKYIKRSREGSDPHCNGVLVKRVEGT